MYGLHLDNCKTPHKNIFKMQLHSTANVNKSVRLEIYNIILCWTKVAHEGWYLTVKHLLIVLINGKNVFREVTCH